MSKRKDLALYNTILKAEVLELQTINSFIFLILFYFHFSFNLELEFSMISYMTITKWL